jgi:glycerol-3-phosphate acyltransferase PlsY
MWLPNALFLLASYLLGTLPTAYIVARLARGIDIRRYGSGSVSASNVQTHVGLRAFALVGAVDFFKGVLPVAVGLWLGLDLWVVMAAGVATVIGHDWSPYLGFVGGRGIGPSMGLLILVAPVEVVVASLIFLAGRKHKYDAFWCILGIALLPVLALLLRRPAPVVVAAAAILLLTILKRLEANRLPVAPGQWRQVLLTRLLFDRDIWDKEAWIQRQPEAREERRGT